MLDNRVIRSERPDRFFFKDFKVSPGRSDRFYKLMGLCVHFTFLLSGLSDCVKILRINCSNTEIFNCQVFFIISIS